MMRKTKELSRRARSLVAGAASSASEITQKNFRRFRLALELFLDAHFGYSYRETACGVFGYFDSPQKILNAARAVREEGFQNFDCFTPFPVEGLRSVMGLRRSGIAKAALIFGIAGALFALILQFITLTHLLPPVPGWPDSLPNFNPYPLRIGGRPSFSWPAMIPVIFEFGILCAALGVVLVFLLLTRLPQPDRKPVAPPQEKSVFTLWIPLEQEGNDREAAARLLNTLGADSISFTADSHPDANPDANPNADGGGVSDAPRIQSSGEQKNGRADRS